MSEIIKRLKSPVVWVAVLTQICTLVAVFRPEISDTVKAVGMPIIEILTLFAVLNDPSSPKSF